MIGIIARADQMATVEEFFQLFKTPWECYRPGRAYEVVIATADEIANVNARLLVIYGADLMDCDSGHGAMARGRYRGGSLRYRGIEVPVYGEILTFEEREATRSCVVSDVGVVGFRSCTTDRVMMRVGYDLFNEVRFLLSAGQPLEHAHIPTLDMHVTMLREWILNAGIALVEIPPVPAGYSFAVCLTHDIDFVGIRNHRFDHTMWGFLYRSTIGAVRNLLRGRFSITKVLQSWRAAASLPFVLLGWVKDFWEPFDWYLQVERNLPATYFFIPFKNRPGDKVAAPHASRRAAAYDLGGLTEPTAKLLKAGCELGVHGIDAWQNVAKGRDELGRISAVAGEASIGVRMHWLLRDENTFRTLEEAGFAYDSSVGYNETIGYQSGTTQVFRPLGARALLELPLHIQDGALFFPHRLDLSESDAWECCGGLIDHARTFGGVLTVLWHCRSHAPERFWGDFYVRLVQALSRLNGWFGTAGQVVGWFRKRREVGFEVADDMDGIVRTGLRYQGEAIRPPLTVRVHRPNSISVDIPWDGATVIDPDQLLGSLAPEATVDSSLRTG